MNPLDQLATTQSKPWQDKIQQRRTATNASTERIAGAHFKDAPVIRN